MVEDKTGIFRRKSLEAISSPDVLDDYLRVTSPGVWLFLAAVVCLLIGVTVWGFLGSVDTTTTVVVVSEGETKACVVPYKSYESVLAAGEVFADEKTYALDPEQVQQQVIDETTDPRILIKGGWVKGDYVVFIGLSEIPEREGVFEGSVVTERIRPVTFLLQ